MKTFYIAFDRVARVAHVSDVEASLPSAPTKLGAIQLLTDTEDDLGYANVGHTLFHGVRDKLYAIGEQNMQAVQIRMV